MNTGLNILKNLSIIVCRDLEGCMHVELEERGEIVVINLSGRIDYESADRFKTTCLNLLIDRKIIFNLQSLNFVGSSGITPFLETMEGLSRDSKDTLKFCSVGSEFRKIFEAGSLKEIEICENTELAQIAFSRPVEAFVESPEEVIGEGYLAQDVTIKE